MTREERRQLLGDAVIEQIHKRVAQAPDAPDDVIPGLRRILTHPAGPAVDTPAAQRAA
ncbi:hypothetical protein ACLQ2N_08465 [Streptomyces sp. DT224]|uniref:hypothetical protein n=1 Tax=Streptomyces sp. DT224 TaxID=3393426 RepID=UPI003CE9F888